MPGFTPIAGIDSSSILHPVLVDANGNFYTVLQGTNGSTTIVPLAVDAAGRLYIVPSGDDHLFGIKSTFAESLSNTNLSAGTNYINAAAIPAHKYLVVTAATVMYSGTVTGVTLAVNGVIASAAVNLFVVATPVNGQFYSTQANWIFSSSDTLSMAITGATAGNAAYFRYSGYYMTAP